MINMRIDLLNYVQEPKAEVKDIANIDKNNDDFKTVLEKTTNKNTDENIVDKTEEVVDEIPVEVEELEDKFIKLEEAIEGGNEEEINETVVEILGMLNIKVINSTDIPVVIDLDIDSLINELDTSLDISSESINLFNIEQTDIVSAYNDGSSSIVDIINNMSLETTDSEAISEDISVLLKGILEGKASDELVNNINKGIENIIPLLVDSEGTEISKDSLLESISMLLSKDSESSEITIENNLFSENFEMETVEGEKTIIDTENSNFKDNNSEENSTKGDNRNTSEGNENDTTLGKEDKVLSKLIDSDNNTFTNAISKLEARNTVGKVEVNAPVTVYKTNMDNDIIKNVKFMIRNSITELKVKIYPKELGEMTVKLLSEEGIMKAEIKAVSKETYDLLNSNISEIKKALSNEDIKIQDVNIGLYSEDTTFYSGDGYSNEDNREKALGNYKSESKLESEDIIENEIIDESTLDSLV